MNEIMNINGIDCYEQDGTAYLKLETVARGLGFTRIADSGNEVIRWERVNKYLDEIGVPTCGHDAFIPENIFYRLAMKAKNEAAEAFQAKIADEVIPSIRKHGTYIIPGRLSAHNSGDGSNAANLRANAMLLNAKSRTAAILQKIYDQAGVKPEYQVAALSDFYAADGVHLPRDAFRGVKQTYDKGTIAEKLGIYSKASGGKKPHAQAVGAIISTLDIRDDEREALPYCNNGHDGVDYQYSESVVEKVRNWMEENGWPSTISVGGKSYAVLFRVEV